MSRTRKGKKGGQSAICGVAGLVPVSKERAQELLALRRAKKRLPEDE